MDKAKLPKNLRSNIISGIIGEEHRRAKMYLLFFTTTLLLSLVGVILSLRYLAISFYQSGFYQYISLLFSGDSAVFSYWKELSLSIIDSMPIIGIIAFLGAVGLLVWSGANTFTNTRRFILQVN